MNTGAITEPVVTLPPGVRAFVAAEYARAATILEYGSGGSTVMAARAGARTFSVESDAAWAGNLEAWLAANALDRTVTLHHADIGPTRHWGRPEKRRLRHLRRYLRYPHSVWERPDFRHPDLILVDGRFRVACVLAAMERITRPTRLLFDDYAQRPGYHAVERFAKPARMVERMAVFDLEPRRPGLSERIATLRLRADME